VATGWLVATVHSYTSWIFVSTRAEYSYEPAATTEALLPCVATKDDMTTITNIVRWLALNGCGIPTIHGDHAWISFGFIHFAFNNNFECDRIQFGLEAG
jgi:hypothetical protein